MNYLLLGKYYRGLSDWIYDGKDFLEYSMAAWMEKENNVIKSV